MKLNRKFLTGGALFCLTALLLSIAPVALAAPMATSAQLPAIQSLEDTLFSIRYEQESPEQRVGRLEETVFGQAQTGTIESRLNKLKGVLSINSLGALTPATQKPTGQGADKTAKSQAKPVVKTPLSKPAASASNTPGNSAQASGMTARPAQPPASQPAPGETDYPTVSLMEQKVFNQTYVQEDITARLARLEQSVFKLPQTGALADRVDNLRLVVLGDVGQGPPAIASYTMPANGLPQGVQSYTPPLYGQGDTYTGYGTGLPYPGSQVNPGGQPYYGQPTPATYQPPAYPQGGDYQASYQPGMNPAVMANGQVSPDMLAAMNEVEKQVIGKTFPSEPVPARLDRLEGKVFHVTSPELPAQERMQRIIAVASAGGAPTTPQAKAKSTFQSLLPIILTILPLILL